MPFSMSGLPPKADIGEQAPACQLCAKSGREQAQQTECLFNDLVGELLQLKRHVETECLGGLEINDQLVFRRYLHRKVGRLVAL